MVHPTILRPVPHHVVPPVPDPVEVEVYGPLGHHRLVGGELEGGLVARAQEVVYLGLENMKSVVVTPKTADEPAVLSDDWMRFCAYYGITTNA